MSMVLVRNNIFHRAEKQKAKVAFPKYICAANIFVVHVSKRAFNGVRVPKAGFIGNR